jgi:AcrR family transcriptional regulator
MRGAHASQPQSLRAEHVEHTRQRLLEAAIDILIDEGSDELSLRTVAKRANVSAPTAYRHFPTRDELIDALTASIEARMQTPVATRTLDEFIAALPQIHQAFADHARLITAYLRARGGDVRLAGRRSRARRVEAAVRKSLPTLSDDEVRAFAPLVQTMSSSAMWEVWRTIWNLEGERAGHIAAWAVRALTDALRADRAGFARAAGVASKGPKR